MSLLTKVSSFFLGISFLLRLHNPISFGASIGLSLVAIFLKNKNSITKWLFKFENKKIILIFFLFIISFIVPSFYSVEFYRSIFVSFYLIFFIVTSFIFYKHFTGDINALKMTLKFLVISTFLSALIIFVYNVYNLKIDSENLTFKNRVIKFKGVTLLFSLLICLVPFFEKQYTKKKYLTFSCFFLLLPIIITSQSLSSILGIIGGISFIIIFLVSNYIKKKRIFFCSLLFIILCGFFYIYKLLPNNFSETEIQKTNFQIPLQIIDAHRQFIWGFSIKEFKKHPIFGIGPDTSNFIEGSQIDIGHKLTGDMNFISSHPHNFIIELLLEVGVFGAVCFFLMIASINYFFLIKKKMNYYLIFFNGYFWSASLVSFSFWNAWWQGSYFLILSIIFACIKIEENSNKLTNPIKR